MFAKLNYKKGKEHFDKKEYKEAIALWEKAAKSRHAEAAYNLGECFSTGVGVPVDYNRALELYLIAAKKSLPKVLTLQEISNDLGISVPSLTRLVQENCDKSPIAYFNELKMEEAKRLLMESPLNITEIAGQLGFSSVHHFSKMFRAEVGISPGAYAKKK